MQFNKYTYIHTHTQTHTERQTYRQTDRQTDTDRYVDVSGPTDPFTRTFIVVATPSHGGDNSPGERQQHSNDFQDMNGLARDPPPDDQEHRRQRRQEGYHVGVRKLVVMSGGRARHDVGEVINSSKWNPFVPSKAKIYPGYYILLLVHFFFFGGGGVR